MQPVLISQNQELLTLLQEVLDQFASGCRLSRADPGEQYPEADFYIWDFHAGLRLPPRGNENGHKHLFLVSRKDLASFSESGPPGANIILKPPSRGAMEAFLCGIRPEEDAGLETLRSERDVMLDAVMQANLKLQEYDQDRTNFLARAVHDFRAPLTAISGYCGLLLGQQLGELNEDQKQVLQRMQHSAKRLSRMASAMFQLSVGRQVEHTLNPLPEDIRECVDQALHEVSPFLQEKRIDVIVDVEPPAEPLCFERCPMEQVLINLLDNACKFTPRAGSIEIRGYPFFWERRAAVMPGYPAERRSRSTRTPNSFRVDIRDSGPGIPAPHLNGIFEEYTIYAGPRDRSGGGLGLAICKMILQNHHGRVWAESNASGAVFSFVLPLAHPELPIRRANGEPDGCQPA